MTIDSREVLPAHDTAPGIDVAAHRGQTVGTVGRHYFNAAGSGLMSTMVAERVVEHLRQEQRIGGYEAARTIHDEAEAAYASAATILGAAPDEIAFFDSATTGLRVIFDGLGLGVGDTVIASRSTYVSQALRLLTMARDHGVRVVVLPTRADGALDLEALAAELSRPRPRARDRVVVCIAHVPTSSGLVEPVVEVGVLARQHNALYVLDATQSVGQIVIDVRQIQCDALVTTGRKFLRGPRGTAFCYASGELLANLSEWAPDVRGTHWDSPNLWTRVGTARSLETWEHGVAARLGLGVALGEAIASDQAAVQRHLSQLASGIRASLSEIPRVAIADPQAATSSIVTFTVEDHSAEDVVAALRRHDVDSSSIPAAHGQWDLGERGLTSVVRIAPHVYNDRSDTRALLETVAAYVEGEIAS